MGFSQSFREHVIEEKGNQCIIDGCGRIPDEEPLRQNGITIHPVNGDDDDERLENAIPVCQSCHIHIHRVDEPPYRYWHRQLPPEDRGASHTDGEYEGPQLSREEAEELRGDDDARPVSVHYKERLDMYS